MSKKTDSQAHADDPQEMGFLAHLLELRDRMLRLVMVIGIIFVCLFPFAQDLYQWLATPVLAQGQGMIATGPIAPVFIPYKVALLTAFLIALPYVFYQLWSFVAPGLYKHEKRLIVPLLTSSIALFYLGIAFAYYLLLPMVFKVVQAMTPAGVMAVPDISAYLDFVMMIFIAFGFGFEMPIATILLISTGMTTAEKLGQKRPYIIVGAFVLGMLLTPPDIISQIMLAIPMWILFEIGLFASRYFAKEIKNAAAAKEKMEEEERAAIDAAAIGSTTSTAKATVTTADESTTGKSAMWEDDEYTYEEDDDVNLDDSEDTNYKDEPDNTDLEDDDDSDDDEEFEDDDDYVPMTDEEMDAELDRIEAEEAKEAKEEEDSNSKNSDS
jgi:sec-independent protein translocase protein TatC